VQAEGEPQVPVPEHVWTPLPEHWVAPGVQTPAQAPFTHAWFVHVTGELHWPLDEQV
jgi:hypothetical protein